MGKTENESLKKELQNKDNIIDALNLENKLSSRPINKEVENYICGMPENENQNNLNEKSKTQENTSVSTKRKLSNDGESNYLAKVKKQGKRFECDACEKSYTTNKSLK